LSAISATFLLCVASAFNGAWRSDRPNSELYLYYLEHKLRLIETVGTAQDKIRFCLDPLAEYLAALAVADLLADNAVEWKTVILEPAQELKESISIETMRGFLLAVQDVCGTRYPQAPMHSDLALLFAC
jgi:hypothetical protein